MERRKVYALLVGINRYRADLLVGGQLSLPPLSGCLADIAAIRLWLEARPELEVVVHSLADEAATKAAIIDGFEVFLAQAQPADSILFYFAGHGALEAADPALWPSESDGRLECIVCYSHEPKAESMLLANKELRWLLSRLSTKTGASITCIFDSCHSGDNTRTLLPSAERPRARKAFSAYVFPARAWETFIFGAYLKPADFQAQSIDELLPEGRYVQMSAADSDEPAVEQGGHGVFSAALLRVLEQGGALPNYRQLHSQISHLLRYRYDQHPRLYSPASEVSDELGATFLGLSGTGMQGMARMTYQAANGGHYFLNRGAIHGLQVGVSAAIWPDPLGEHTWRGHITQLGLDQAEVSWDTKAAEALNKTSQYVLLEGLSTGQAYLHLSGETTPSANFDLLLDKLPAELRLCAQEAEADWVLHRQSGWWWLALPAAPWRPLVMPLPEKSASSTDKMLADLKHLLRFHFLKNLHNRHTESSLAGSPLKIEAMEESAPGDWVPLALENEGWQLRFRPEKQTGTQNIRIRISNESPEKLYVAALIFGADYGIRARYLLNPTTVSLEKGQSKWLRDHKSSTMELAMAPLYYWYNWPMCVDTLQFVYSDQPFDLSELSLPPLPRPFVPGEPMRAGRENMPGWANKLKDLGWQTRCIELRLANPWYRKLPQEDQDLIQQDERLAFWAAKALDL